MKPLHILHITHSLNVGGLERVVVDLAKGFKRKGHFVSICCLDGQEPLGDEAESAGVKVFSLKKTAGVVWNLPFRIVKLIKREKINVVHTHNEAGLIYGAAAAIIARVPNIIHSEHGKEPGYECKRALHIFEKLLLYKKVEKIVTVSQDLKDRISNSLGINEERIAVIPNGIDVEKYFRPECSSEKRMSLGIGPQSFVIGNIARLVPLKNHQFLLTIFRELLEHFTNLRLLIVGDGPLRDSLESYSREIGISKFVLFLGERHDIPELLAAFDLFILPSLTEGISVTLLEAMASSKPIVASDVGGNSEIIENKKSGLLISLGETSRWVEAIKSIIQDNNVRRRFSEMARRSVIEGFSLSVMIGKYERVYTDI